MPALVTDNIYNFYITGQIFLKVRNKTRYMNTQYINENMTMNNICIAFSKVEISSSNDRREAKN